MKASEACEEIFVAKMRYAEEESKIREIRDLAEDRHKDGLINYCFEMVDRGHYVSRKRWAESGFVSYTVLAGEFAIDFRRKMIEEDEKIAEACWIGDIRHVGISQDGELEQNTQPEIIAETDSNKPADS